MGGQGKLWTKIVLDLLMMGLLVGSWTVYVVEYPKGIQIGVVDVTYHTALDGDLDSYVVGTFPNFCQTQCTKLPKDFSCSFVCTNFKSAGICYLTLSAVSFLILAYCVLNLVCLSYGCSSCFSWKFQAAHFFHLFAYTLGVFLYVTVSSLITLEIEVGPGLILMTLIEAIAWINTVVFCLVRRNWNREIRDKDKFSEGSIDLAVLSSSEN